MEFLFDILIVQDNNDDSHLAEMLLRRTGIGGNFIRVDNKQDFIRQIHNKKYDVIIADNKFPHFGWMEVQSICRSEYINTPVILITDTLPENEEEKMHQSNLAAIVLKEELKFLPQVVMNIVLHYKLWSDARGVKQDVMSGVPSLSIV